MIYRDLGKTGMKVSSLSFGASSLGGVFHSIRETEGIEAVNTALDNGINLIDMSPYYGHYGVEVKCGAPAPSVDELKKLGYTHILIATGFSSAVAIAEHILTTGDASGYLKFLTTGGSDYPLEELKIAGIDLTKPDTVRSALRVFDETVDELSALLL